MKRCLFILLIFVCAGVAGAQNQSQKQVQNLTLNEAIRLGLKNNLDIQVEQYSPEILQTNVSLERAKFEPFFAANVNTQDATQPTGSFLVGQEAINNKNVDYNASLQQLLKTGTSYQLQFNNSRIRTTRSFTTVNPEFDTSLFLTVTQPLMRNFGLDITTMPLRIVEQDRLASDFRLQQKVMDISLQIEQTYWNLVFARGGRDVAEQALASAKDLYENNKKQVEVGTMAPLEIVVAEAEVASTEQAIIAADALIQNTGDSLRKLIYVGEDADKWNVEIAPTDQPDVQNVSVSEEEAIQRALSANPDLKALAADVDSTKLSAKLAANALRPQFDLKGSVGYAGLGGRSLLLDDSTFPPLVIGSVPGGYGNALGNLFDNRTWSVGFVVGIPIGNGAARAGYVKADLTQKQATTTLENGRKQLILNVRTAYRNLQSDLKQLDAARASRVLQERKLDAERKKLNVGLSTNHTVLDFVRDLAQSQLAELLARVNYNKDQAQLDRLMGNTPTK